MIPESFGEQLDDVDVLVSTESVFEGGGAVVDGAGHTSSRPLLVINLPKPPHQLHILPCEV